MAASQPLGAWTSEFGIVCHGEKYTGNTVQLPACLMCSCEVCSSKKKAFSWLSATAEKCACDSFSPSVVEELSQSCGKKPLLESVLCVG